MPAVLMNGRNASCPARFRAGSASTTPCGSYFDGLGRVIRSEAPAASRMTRASERRQRVREVGLADLLELVADAQGGLADLDHAAQVDGRSHQHDVARRTGDRGLEVPHLL